MSEMEERVARAMSRHRWDEFDEEHRQAARELAREAINAMREPTEDMITQAIAPYVYNNDDTMNKAMRAAVHGYWTAMIAEILKD